VERRVGVKIGDWISYDIDVSFYSDDPHCQNLTSIDGWDLNLQNMTVTVLDVSGTTITIQRLFHFKNGTEETQDPWTEDVNGSCGFIISADLNAGDTLFPNDSTRINETIFREYLEQLRQVNHVNYTSTKDPHYISYNASMQVYFDRATGVPLEFTQRLYSITKCSRYVTNESVSMIATDTNLWDNPTIPELPSTATLPLFMILTLLAVIVCIGKHQSNLNSKAS
jgi:hypothetical protein